MTSHGENLQGEFRPGENGAGLFAHGGNAATGFAPGANPTSEEERSASDPGPEKRRRRVGGRPRKAASERRTTKFTVAVNEAEKSAVEEAASSAGLTPAAYLRAAALSEAGVGSRLAKRKSDALYHRLSRIGVRLQHLARRAGDAGRTEEQAALEALLQDVIGVRGTL